MASKALQRAYDEVTRLHRKHYNCGVRVALGRWAEKHTPNENAYNSKGEGWQMIHEATTCEGWQIDRYYVADYKRWKRTGEVKLRTLYVAYEYWFNPVQKQSVLMGKGLGMNCGWCRIPFSTWSDFKVKKGYNTKHGMGYSTYSYYGGTNYYEDWNNVVHYPRQRVLKEYTRMNLAYLFTYENEFHKILKGLTRSNALETISKTGMGGENMLRAYFHYRAEDIETHFRSLVIANRHGYLNNVADLGMYLDYLNELKTLKLDLRNPHYICPKDLAQAHAQTSARITRIKEEERKRRQEQEEIRRYKTELRYEADYIKGREMFFGLEFGNRKYDVSVLKSVEDFLNEGLTMHHCVYSCGYYKLDSHPNALILSVRNKQGEREVTIEYNIKTNKIMQCFAKYDSIHADDKGIRALVMAHAEEIDAIAHPKKTRKNNKTNARVVA